MCMCAPAFFSFSFSASFFLARSLALAVVDSTAMGTLETCGVHARIKRDELYALEQALCTHTHIHAHIHAHTRACPHNTNSGGRQHGREDQHMSARVLR